MVLRKPTIDNQTITLAATASSSGYHAILVLPNDTQLYKSIKVVSVTNGGKALINSTTYSAGSVVDVSSSSSIRIDVHHPSTATGNPTGTFILNP